MRSGLAQPVLAVLAAVLAAGCGPEPAAPPGPAGPAAPRPALAATMGRLTGRVVTLDRSPLAGARVAVERGRLDVRENRLDAYERDRQSSAVVTGADGSFTLAFGGEIDGLVIDRPGFLPARVAPNDGLEVTLLADQGPRVASHRGTTAHAPENTLSAFRKAALLGVHLLELDVHLTRDDQVVVLHDETLDRTTDGTGRVRDRTLAEVRALDAGAWFDPSYGGERVPLLAEVLELGRRYAVGLLVEVKATSVDPDIAMRRTLEVIAAAGAADLATVYHFDPGAVATCVAAGVTRCAFAGLSGRSASAYLAQALYLGVDLLLLESSLATAGIIEKGSELGIEVYTFNGQGPADCTTALDQSAAGLITDAPGACLELLGTIALAARGRP